MSLNFIKDIDSCISELRRVLKEDSVFLCSVPVPEKKKPKVKINGVLFSANELRDKFQKQGFIFEELPHENGALLYFRAILTKNE